MAELSTVARPYSEALFAVAQAGQGGLAVWAEQVQRLAHVAANADVRSAMADPRLDDAQRVSIFLSLVRPAVDKQVQNFVEVLMANDRLLLLPQIAEQFEAIGGRINAYTSREKTVYYAKILKKDSEFAIEFLADIIQNSIFDGAELASFCHSR
jgi:F-type H+-transporting ATPase subunit delta